VPPLEGIVDIGWVVELGIAGLLIIRCALARIYILQYGTKNNGGVPLPLQGQKGGIVDLQLFPYNC